MVQDSKTLTMAQWSHLPITIFNTCNGNFINTNSLCKKSMASFIILYTVNLRLTYFPRQKMTECYVRGNDIVIIYSNNTSVHNFY